jgi:multidrug efflux pump
MFGSEYAMRVWLDPTSSTVWPDRQRRDAAISAQNNDVSVGQLGDLPAVPASNSTSRSAPNPRCARRRNSATSCCGSARTARAYYLRDVARVEFGGRATPWQARANGQPAAGIAIKLSPSVGQRALHRHAVRAKMAELSKFFPAGIQVDYPMDSSPFIQISIEEVIKTLVEAIVLVFLVMYLFLQNLRATLIPTIVIPVALLGTFASLYAFGFSINVLTLFGVVLAIGILVDDAIVVIENVERLMHDEGLPPREATHQGDGSKSPARSSASRWC